MKALDRIPDLVANVPSAEERVIRQERIQRLLNGSQELRFGDARSNPAEVWVRYGRPAEVRVVEETSIAFRIPLTRAAGTVVVEVFNRTTGQAAALRESVAPLVGQSGTLVSDVMVVRQPRQKRTT